MSIWYAICEALPFEMLQWDFMKNALLNVIIQCFLANVKFRMRLQNGIG